MEYENDRDTLIAVSKAEFPGLDDWVVESMVDLFLQGKLNAESGKEDKNE